MITYNSEIRSLILEMTESQRARFISLFKEFSKEGLDEKIKNSLDFSISELVELVQSISHMEKMEKIAIEAMERGETSIPEKSWGVHQTHCCVKHGCKYGKIDCPVVVKKIKQDHPCEFCDDDLRFKGIYE